MTATSTTKPAQNLPKVSGCEDPIDILTARAHQLESLLFMMHGAQLDDFLDMSKDVQDGLTWLAACLATDVRELARAVACKRGGGTP